MNGIVKLTGANGEKKNVDVTLNPHLLRKMEQAQRNMIRFLFRRDAKGRRCFMYWSKLFQKWSDLLITRATVIEEDL